MNELSRRAFLKNTALASASAPLVLGSGVWGASAPSPSERITMALIGVRNMGGNHLRTLQGNDRVQILAVCDVDDNNLNAAKQSVLKAYAQRAKSGTFQGCDATKDFREVMARKDIDAVCIATPDHWHTLISLAAIRSGKDVYCEKPLTLTIREGRVLSDEVERYGRVFQCGSQQRSDWRFRHACELVRNGRIGELQRIKVGLSGGKTLDPQPEMPVPKELDYDMWLGQAPWAPYTEKRVHYNFRFILDYSGGQVTNWGAHHIDIAQWGHGSERWGPVEMEGRGEFPKDGLYTTVLRFQFQFKYGDGVPVDVSTSHRHGIRFEGSEGWVYVDRKTIESDPASIVDSKIGPDEIRLYQSTGHWDNFLRCVRSRNETVAPAEIAHRTTTICHMGNIAMLLDRKLKWDPKEEVFIGDEEANRMRSRPMREPWSL